MKKFLAIVSVVLMTATAYSQKVKLVLNLEQGKTYTQHTASNAHVVQSLMGQKMEMDVLVNGELAFLVKEAGKDSYLLEGSYKELSMKMNLPGNLMESSSVAGADGDELSSVLAAMVDKPFEVILEKNGKVREIKNAEAIWESAIDEIGELGQAQKAQFKQQLKQAYGSDAMIGNIEKITAILPGKKVKPGSQWTIETVIESGFSAKMVSVYEYAGMEGDKALIKGKSAISTLENAKYTEMAGLPVKYLLEGDAESEIWVDVASGWLSEGKEKQSMEGSIKLKDSPQTPGGMEIPMSIENVTVLSGSY